MKPRIGFVLEQSLGHVAYGMGLRSALDRRTDIECVWLPVPFEESRASRLSLVGRNWTVRGSARANRVIARAERKRPLDALLINTQTISLFAGSFMRRIPTVLSLDATPRNFDELAQYYGEDVHSPVVERVKLEAHRAVMRNAAWFTCWSQWAKRSLVDDYHVDGSRVTILPPGTTLENFPSPHAKAPRKPGPLRLLFCGGDFKRKGGDLLLDVFRQHFRDSCELHLITGAELESEPGVHVYRGLKPHSPELTKLYAEADVFVLPTRADCLAVVLGEAMASSLPIITTCVGAHAEAVEDSRSGFVLDVDDAEGLRDRIARLVRNPDLAANMGRRSRQIGEERFDMQKNASALGDLLRDLALARKAATNARRAAAT